MKKKIIVKNVIVKIIDVHNHMRIKNHKKNYQSQKFLIQMKFLIFAPGKSNISLLLKEKRVRKEKVFCRADIELEEGSRAAFAVVQKRTVRHRERRVHWRIYE